MTPRPPDPGRRARRLAPPAPRKTTLLCASLAIALLTSACVERPAAFDQALVPKPFFAVGESLVTWDTAARRFARVKLDAGNDPSVSYVPWNHRVDQFRTTGEDLLALAVATRALGRVGVDGDVRVWPLPSEFTTMTVGDDGKHVALWHANGGSQATTLVNPSEVALVEVGAEPGPNNPQVATITGLSRPPQAVRVSPPITAADGEHRVVWVEAVSRLGVADFGPGGVKTVVVPLTPPDSDEGLLPRRTLTRVEGNTLHLYLIAGGSDDVVHVSLGLGGSAPAVAIDQLAATKSPNDLLLFEVGGELRVAAVSHVAREMAVLDPATGAGTLVSLPYRASAFIPYESADGAPRALVWDAIASRKQLQMVSLDLIEKKKGKAIDVVSAELPVTGVTRAQEYFALRHANQSSGLSLLEPATGKVTSFAGTGSVKELVMRGGHLMVHGRFGNDSRVSRIDLADLHGVSGQISPGGDALLPLGASGVALSSVGFGGQRLAVLPDGDVKATPNWFEGFLLEGLLDREITEPKSLEGKAQGGA